jgi:hypothetical protein
MAEFSRRENRRRGLPVRAEPPSTHLSVIVVGYDQHDSHGYLGGTGTKIINPDPQ